VETRDRWTEPGQMAKFWEWRTFRSLQRARAGCYATGNALRSKTGSFCANGLGGGESGLGAGTPDERLRARANRRNDWLIAWSAR